MLSTDGGAGYRSAFTPMGLAVDELAWELSADGGAGCGSAFTPMGIAVDELAWEEACRLEPIPLSWKLLSLCTAGGDESSSFLTSRSLFLPNNRAPLISAKVSASRGLFPPKSILSSTSGLEGCWTRLKLCLQFRSQVLNASFDGEQMRPSAISGESASISPSSQLCCLISFSSDIGAARYSGPRGTVFQFLQICPPVSSVGLYIYISLSEMLTEKGNCVYPPCQDHPGRPVRLELDSPSSQDVSG